MDTEQHQVFIGGIQKFTEDRDFAKFIEKTLPDYDNVVVGISKKRGKNSLIVRLKNCDAKAHFIDVMTGKNYKNRPLKVKNQMDPVANKHFVSMKKLLKPKEVKIVEMTKEEIDSEMKKNLKDKLIPYHNTPYDEQIRLKSEHLKEIFYKFVARVEKEVLSGAEAKLPGWLTNYWLKLEQLQSKENEPKEIVKVEEQKSEQEEEKEGEGDDNISENDNQTLSKVLPCDFDGIIT